MGLETQGAQGAIRSDTDQIRSRVQGWAANEITRLDRRLEKAKTDFARQISEARQTLGRYRDQQLFRIGRDAGYNGSLTFEEVAAAVERVAEVALRERLRADIRALKKFVQQQEKEAEGQVLKFDKTR